MKRFAITMLLCATSVGCGGAAAPQEQLASSLAAIRAAEVGGAGGEPRAALLVKKATDQVNAAKALMADDDNERAAMVLERAQADAELALAIAQEVKLRNDAMSARQEVEDLKKKLPAGGQK